MNYILVDGSTHIEQMAALGEESYGKQNDISRTEFLEWQLLNNPAGKTNTALAINDDGQVVGEFSPIACRMRVFGKEVAVNCMINTLIRKQDRALPVFYALHKLGLEACAENEFVFAVPNPNSYPLFSKVFAFKTVAQIPLLIFPMRPRALVSKRIGAGAGFLIPGLVLGGRKRRLPAGTRIGELDEGSVEVFFANLPDSMKEKYPIIGVRDPNFIKWRYFDNPLNKYKIFAAWESSEPAGFAVVRVMEVDSIVNGMVVDFLVKPGRRDLALALLSQCLRFFRSQKVELVGTLMLPHCEEYAVLKSAGFLVCPEKFLPQPFPLIVKPMKPRTESKEADSKQSNAPQADMQQSADIPACTVAENWFITMGDYDAV